MTADVDMDALNLARIEARLLEWMRAGRLLYKAHARGETNIDPADIITKAEETK